MLMLTVDERKRLRIQPQDSHGNPSKLDSIPEWSSSDETVLTLTVEEDGLSALTDLTGKIGSTQVNCRADARIGDEVLMLTGTLDVSVVAGETAVINIVAEEATV